MNRRIVATTLTDLRVSPSFLVERATQLTCGTEVDVLTTEGEWCRVRQLDGYEGWAYASYLADPSTCRGAATHLASAATLVLREPQHASAPPVSRLPIGTSVILREQRGECARVEPVAGTTPSGWAPLGGLRTLASDPLPTEQARAQIVADARRLTGVYYLWGGTTAWGIDCSGLAQLCHRLVGVALSRDARMQFADARARDVQPPFDAGDLIFFHGETDKQKITHVGISIGGWRIIHSSRSKNGVYEEDLESAGSRRLRDRFAGARSFLV